LPIYVIISLSLGDRSFCSARVEQAAVTTLSSLFR